MRKNKKLLVSFLALNSVLSMYSTAAPVTAKYNRMYNNMVKNINQGKSNEKNYETIQKILNQKNKELKDLYLQGEYIVKPEYLEWQVFFTGFYDEYGKGVDNSAENAEYHSKVTGYYDAGGNYVVTSGSIKGLAGKGYRALQQPKDINLGVSIPLKGLSREPLNLSLTPAGEININPGSQNVTPPVFSINPTVTTNTFNIDIPNITVNSPTVPTPFSVKPPGTGNGDETYTALRPTDVGTTYRGYTAMISQYNLTTGNMTAHFSGSGYTGLGSCTSGGCLTSYDVENLNGAIDWRVGSGANYGATDPVINDLTVSSAPGVGKAVYDSLTALYKITAAEKIILGIPNNPVGGTADNLVMTLDSKATGNDMPHLIQFDPHTNTNRKYTAYIQDHYGNATGRTNTSDQESDTDKRVQYYYNVLENHGLLQLKGSNGLLIGLQSHNGVVSAVYENYGEMIGLNEGTNPTNHVAHAFIAAQNNSYNHRRFEFYNKPGGLVELRAKSSIAYYYGDPNNYISNKAPHYNIFNEGRIVLYGSENIGISTNGASRDPEGSKIVLYTPIEINGDNSIGVEISKLMDDGYETPVAENPSGGANTYDARPSAIRVIIGKEENKYAGNSTGLNSAGNPFEAEYVEDSVGLYIDKAGLTYRLKDFGFEFGDYARYGKLVYLKAGTLYLDNRETTDINITAGKDNYVFISDSSSSDLTVNPNLNIGTEAKPVNGTIGILGINNGKIHFGASNSIKTYGENSHAVIIQGGSVLNNAAAGLNHSFEVNGKGSIALYVNQGTADFSNSPEINVKAVGEKAVGVYNSSGVVKLGASGTGTGTYTADGLNSVLFYNKTTNAANSIETSGSIFTVKNGGLFSYIENKLSAPQIKFTNTGGTTLNLSDGARGFIYTGNNTSVAATDIQNYFNDNYSGHGNMTVNLSSNASLFVIQEFGSISLDDVNTVAAGTGIFNQINNTGGKNAFLTKGTLVLNPASNLVDLDSPSELYLNIDKALLGITVNSGVTVKGTQDGQAALADDNSYDAVLHVKMENNGTIDLQGKSSIGIYTNNGKITNNNIINVSGDSSLGIFSENGTVTSNTGTINIGNGSVGIYGISHQNPASVPAHGGGLIDIANTGVIRASAGTGAIGIYADNNRTGGIASDADIDLSTGTIDVKNSENAVGVYVNKGTIADSGSRITVGKNSVALYAKDSDVSLNGITIDLNGDNALGIFLDGTSSLATTGTNIINIDGRDIILFNMNSSGAVSNNFTVGSIAPGSTYTLGNITGGVFKYTGNSELASNGTLVTGKESAVYLDGSTVTSAAGSVNVAAIALNDQYSGLLPLPAGMTAGIDGENNGTIILGDGSAGIYGKNGSRISNKGAITVGSSSAGLMTSGSGSKVLNSGMISVGTGSQGIYLKDGISAENLGAGNISGTGAGTIGIYADSNISTMQISNDGIINLSGDKSVGIYTTGTNSYLIDNNSTGIISIGNSTNTSDPGIGIYGSTAGSIITNHGTVSSGENSIGAYSSSGTVDNNGIFNVGNSGVGIYSSNGIVNLNTGSAINMGTNGAVAVYGVNSAVTNSSDLNIGDKNYGFILKGGSLTTGAGTNSILGNDSVYMYSTEAVTVINNGNVAMTGSDNIGFYMAKDPVSKTGGGTIVNSPGSVIAGTAGDNNIGIYNYGGIVDNYGMVMVGGSELKLIDGTSDIDVKGSKYSVGIYGENAAVTNYGSGLITAGYGGFGIVAKGGTASNFGIIITNGDHSTGMYTEDGIITNEAAGVIDVTGKNAIGMAGKGEGSQLINHGTINIDGDGAIGMYGNVGTVIFNSPTGIINVTGNGQAFVSADPANSSHNIENGSAFINGAVTANVIESIGSSHTLPTLINAGIIKSSGVLALDGMQVMIKPDPTTKQPSSDPDYDFELSGTSIIADQVTASKPIVILPGFSDGLIANVIKLEGLIQATSGQYDFISGSLLWEATPKATGSGSDVYMSRKAFTEFTDGLWFEDFGTALENNYMKASGDGVTIYNKTGYITNETDFRHIMASLAGNVYANINQRENDIARTFEDSMHLLQNSVNNTKENVKISVIAGKGKNKEETDGVVSYDYATTGVLALREVERTYRHTFGYSVGYLHTGFEFNDGNSSEEWVDTIQLGVHNKYKSGSWEVRNDLTGRVSFHNVDRNIDWPSPLVRSEMNGTYETYSLTSDNILGKEFGLGKKASIMPYAAFRAMYVTRPAFDESGLESLEVEGNDAWSAKPRAGVELKGSVPLGAKSAWKLKGTLDLAYEYELADLNEREKARLTAIEDGYHELSKPQEEKGAFRTRAEIGVEVEDRYGVFITGEYLSGNDKEDDYRAGVTLKAVF
ncbi:MAG: autotransporter domain-containing protein [Sebaldella sp.]|nr:autotransporter domain-containing protein [Sebaldella sp.]